MAVCRCDGNHFDNRAVGPVRMIHNIGKRKSAKASICLQNAYQIGGYKIQKLKV